METLMCISTFLARMFGVRMVSYMPSLIYGGLSPAMSTLGIPLRDEGPMNSFHCLHNCGYTFLPLNNTMEKAITNKAKHTTCMCNGPVYSYMAVGY